jgi:hypothetical protein
MPTTFRLLRRALRYAPLLVLGSCATDERALSFGIGATGAGSASSLSNGGSNPAGGDSATEGGEDPGQAGSGSSAGNANGGESDGAGSGGSGSSHPSGGAPEADGGSPPVPVSGSGGGLAEGGKGGAAGSMSGGSAGTGGTGFDPDSGPCGDLDADGVQDCDETVAQNPRFDQDAKSWSADSGVTQSWQADDARAKPGSGSLKVTFTTGDGSSGWALGATGQCVPAWGEDSYEVAARARVANAQAGGQAQLSLAFFGNEGCADSFLGSVTVQTTDAPGVWSSLRGSLKAPAGSRSVLVRLAAAKLGSQTSLEVHFDDVLFRKK